MKKVFVKPQVKKVQLNFRESIATSAPTGPQGEAGSFSLNWTDRWSCAVYTSGVMFDDINAGNYMSTLPCLIFGISPQSAARSMGLPPSAY